MGKLKLKGPGYDSVNANMAYPVLGTNAGILHHDRSDFLHNGFDKKEDMITTGYGAHVIIGEEYLLEDLQWMGQDIVIEVSDPSIPMAFGRY